MANGQSGYYLESDVRKSGGDLQDLWGGSLDQQAGINKYRGIGRGAGTLAGILLAGSGAGIPLLALAGGLGSLGGSLVGGALGKHKYGSPVKAEKGGLFHRDIAKKQRESVDDYWKGMKEQIGVNTLQDAITAGMYGSQVQDIFQQGRLALGGQPAGMAMPPSTAASKATLQQPNTAGIFPDAPTKLKLPQNMLKQPAVYPSAPAVIPKPPLKPAMPAVDFPASVATPELLGNVPINQISGMQGYTPWEPLKEQYMPYGAFYNSIINKNVAPISAGSAVMGNQYGGRQIMHQ